MADLRLKHLEEQLKKIGCNFQFWGRAELRELANVLLPDEVVKHVVNGTYEGGFAQLAATDQRVLLIDKKPMYLTLEDVRFDMIAEIDYNHRLVNATVCIFTPNKSLRFTGFNQVRLRNLFHFVQTRVMEIRQHYAMQAQQFQGPVDGLPPSPPADSLAPLTVAAGTALPPAGPVQEDQRVIASQAQELGSYSSVAPIQPPEPQAALHESRPQVSPAQYHHRQPPIVSAYTRLPMMSRQRRFLGAQAVNIPPAPPVVPQQQ